MKITINPYLYNDIMRNMKNALSKTDTRPYLDVFNLYIKDEDNVIIQACDGYRIEEAKLNAGIEISHDEKIEDYVNVTILIPPEKINPKDCYEVVFQMESPESKKVEQIIGNTRKTLGSGRNISTIKWDRVVPNGWEERKGMPFNPRYVMDAMKAFENRINNRKPVRFYFPDDTHRYLVMTGESKEGAQIRAMILPIWE